MTTPFMRIVNQSLAQFAKAKEGAVFIFVGFGIIAAVTATMVAVEVSNVTKVKSDFRNAVDQALLAAASKNKSSGSEADMQLTGQEYLKANLSDVSGLSNVQFRVSKTATNWRADASATLEGAVTKIIGVGSHNIAHVAEVGFDQSRKAEIVAMFDVSGTMCARFDRSPSEVTATYALVPDRACTKLKMMQEALKKIVENGVGTSADGQAIYKLGVVPFTFKVNLANPSAVPNFLIQAEIDARDSNPDDPNQGDPNYFTDLQNAETLGNGNRLPLPAVIPLTPIATEGDKQNYLNRIDGLVTGNVASNEFNRRAWKRSSLAAQISAMMLDPRYHAMFGGERAAPFNTPGTDKVVIMMTDAANLGCCFTNWPEGNFRSNYIYSFNPDHLHLVGTEGQAGVCQQMKEAGIKVYTLLLDVNEGDMNERGREIVEAYERCASEPKYAFRVPYGDNTALENAYRQIAASIVRLKLTY